MSISAEKEEKYRNELNAMDNEQLIELVLTLQGKMINDIDEIHEIRRKTLEEDGQLRAAEKEIALIVDEREYAYSSAWTDNITKETKADPWMARRVASLDRETKDVIRQYDKLNDFTKNLIYEKKLTADVETPKICINAIEKLEKELATLRQLYNEVKISLLTDEALGDYVQGHKEEVTLLTEANLQTRGEKIGVNLALQEKELDLSREVKKLEQYKYSCVDHNKTWRILPQDEAEQLKAKITATPAAEAISDIEE